MTTVLEIFAEVIKTLEKQNIEYMVVGSVASIIYGEPRMTQDMDIVININPQDANKIESSFPLEQYYCPPLEVIKAELNQRGQFNLLHHKSGLKIDVMIRKNSPHSIEEFKRRHKVSFIKDFEVYLAKPEDVIIKKLVFYREGNSAKHITDIRGILSETPVDHDYLNKWITELNLSNEYALTQ